MVVTQPNDWYRSAFSKDYLKIYAHRDASEAQTAIANLVKTLDLPVGSTCLDLCCGFGRHLPPLDAAGLRVVGCDLSMDLLCCANSGGGRLIRGNMASLPFVSSSFDAIFSFFTSFGYFDTNEGNARVVDEIARSLKQNGLLVMDFLNPIWVRETLVPEDETNFPDFTLKQKRWIDHEENTVNKELIVLDGDGERRYSERVKLYGPDDFGAFFKRSGLRELRVIGDYDGGAFNPSSPRQIHIAEKA